MSECNFIETTNIYSNLNDQMKFRWNEINKIQDYFNSEIQEKKIMSKKLSKYITASEYIEKTLIVLSTTSGGVSNISFGNVIGVPAGIASARFTFVFFENKKNKERFKNNKK